MNSTALITNEWRRELDDLPFEELYRRLTETVARLEQGELSLTDAERLYLQGMELSQRCQQLLSATELRITQVGDGRTPGNAGSPPPAFAPDDDFELFDDDDDDGDGDDDDVPF